MCGSHCEAWRRKCDGVEVLCWWHCKWHSQSYPGYHSILQRHAIPSGLRLVGPSFVFQQDSDPKHTSRLCKELFAQGEWWSAASDDLASTTIKILLRCLGWVGPESEGKVLNTSGNCWKLWDSWKTIPGDNLMRLTERMPRVFKGQGGYFKELKI